MVTAAVITGVAMVVAALVPAMSKIVNRGVDKAIDANKVEMDKALAQNSAEHSVTKALLGNVSDGQKAMAEKIDRHIEWHAHGPQPYRKLESVKEDAVGGN